jgi:uncharacterized membrane protein YkoI
MLTRIFRTIIILFLIFGASQFACGSKKSESAKTQKKETTKEITLVDLPQPVRITVLKLTAGGMIKKIEQDTEDAQLIYNVAADMKGKDVEYYLGANGALLTSTESVEFTTMPEAVCSAAEKYFGTAEGLTASKEVKKDINYYEVEGKKDGKLVSIKLSELGQIVEEENQE